jgi:GABA(A) receptor-associated protein
MDYKQRYSFAQRKEISERLRQSHPDRVPIILVRGNNVQEVERQKYLVPSDTTVGKFLYEVRKNLKLNAEKAIFIFTNKQTLPPITLPIGTLYQHFQDEDGFLYLTYSGENTFG